MKPAAAAAVALVAAAAALVDIDGATVVAYVDDTADAVMTTVAGAPASGGNARSDPFLCSGIEGFKGKENDEKLKIKRHERTFSTARPRGVNRVTCYCCGRRRLRYSCYNYL